MSSVRERHELRGVARRAPSVPYRRRAALALAGAVASTCTLYISCGDPSHLYQGRYYVAERDCLGTVSSLDVVPGDDTGDCAPICLVDTLADASNRVYVSTMCGPYPYGMDPSGDDPACPKALAALERDDTCASDGGSSNPVEAGDPEGTDAAIDDDGPDATTD